MSLSLINIFIKYIMGSIDEILDLLKTQEKSAKEELGPIKDMSAEDKKLLISIKKEIASTEKLKKVADKSDTDDDKKQIAEAKGNLKDVKKIRRTIKVLQKQAGAPAGQQMNKVKKAQPRPANSNEGNVRCYIRYNNQGNPYRICDGGEPKDGFPKPPSQITAPITPQAFMEHLDKTYIELTDGQRGEYHRLDMANRRLEERMDDKVAEQYAKVIKNQRKVRKAQARLNKLEGKEDDLQDKKKEQDFKAELKKMGPADVRRKKGSEAYKQFRKDFGLKEDKLQKRFGKAKQATAEQQQELQDAKDDYKTSQGKYQLQFKKSSKPVSVAFD